MLSQQNGRARGIYAKLKLIEIAQCACRIRLGKPLPEFFRQAEQRHQPVADAAGSLRDVQFFPCSESFFITSSMLKLAGFCRGGNSLKLEIHLATKAWAGTMANIRCAAQSL